MFIKYTAATSEIFFRECDKAAMLHFSFGKSKNTHWRRKYDALLFRLQLDATRGV